MTDQRPEDRMQSDHERRVAEIEEERGQAHAEDDPTEDPGRRPTSGEDLAADRAGDDADVVGDHETSPRQNSDRRPQ